jgi:glycerol-3-phosphate acyltransferase PlsY
MVDVALAYLVAIVAGYLLGSIPSGLWIGKAFYKVDPRDGGSGKTGATNVLRTLGPTAMVAVVAVDAAKSVLSVSIAQWFAPLEYPSHGAAALAAMIGHTWPVFAGFRGGRGVLVGAASFIALDWQIFLVALTIFVLTAWGTRMMSVASLVSAFDVPIMLAWRWHTTPDFPFSYLAYGILAGTFVVLSHRDNIRRIANGTERRIGGPSRTS